MYEKINLLQEYSVSDNTLSKVYSPLIGKEKNIFIIDSHIDPITNEDTWKIIRLTNAIIGYQLRQMQDNHIVFAPLSDKNFNHDLFIHHFKDIDKNPTTISLKFGRTDEHNQNIFRIGFTDQSENIETTVNTSTSVNETITTLEQKIIEKLEEFSDQLLTTNNISLEEINALHQLEFIKKSQTWNQVTHLRELNYLIEQATITKSDLIAYIAINHFIGYTYRWARDFEIDHIYEDIRPILNGQTTLSHNYLLAHFSKTLFHCTQSRGQCREHYVDYIERNHSLYGSEYLSKIIFPDQSHTPIPFAKHNYMLNPLFDKNKSYYTYFFSLLENGYYNEIQDLLNAADFWEDRDMSGKAMYGTTTLSKINHFQNWYNARIHRILEHKDKDLYADFYTSTSYITHNLLNANRADIAFKWAEYSKDSWTQLELFFLASLWHGSWDQYKWLRLSDIADERFDSLNTYYKWRLAYFEYLANMPERAYRYYDDIFPELFGRNPSVNHNNIRGAVYLIEVLKQLNRKDEVEHLTHSVQVYLDELSPNFSRNAFFGLTDAQFFARNGQSQKALERIKYAIVNENWLPNSYWLWPPLDKDPYFKNLRQHPKFKRFVEVQNKNLANFCLGDNC